jgi:hypothetical protein
MLLRKDFSRPMLLQHVLALVTCLALGMGLLFDRRPPLQFSHGAIVPVVAAPGATVHVRWNTIWRRQCLGMVSRDIVGSDNVIRIYRRHELRVPASLGPQTSDTPFALTNALPPGRTEYRAVIQFDNCGITSRLWPLTVDVPKLVFEIR